MSNFGNNLGCGCGCGGNSPCQPANVVYQSTCTDPGSATNLAYLTGLDQNFCERRFNAGNGGFFVAVPTGSGGFNMGFTVAPQVALTSFQAGIGTTFGNLTVLGSDSILRYLIGPATANQYVRTNASGQLIFGPLPASSVPDPLTVGTINATNFTLGNGTITGALSLPGVSSGTLSTFLGLDVNGNVITGTPSNTGSQVAMFFESPTTVAATSPNAPCTQGIPLTIGNLIFDSVTPAVPGGALITPTNSQTLTVVTAGTYVFHWGGEIRWTGGSSGKPSIQLLINGVIVNNGYSRNFTGGSNVPNGMVMSGVHGRKMAAGDTIQLQPGTGSGNNISMYEVRLLAERTGT
jgi:hypothetical protein